MKSEVKHSEKKKMAQPSAGSDDARIRSALIGKFAQEFYYQFINVSEGTQVMESGTVLAADARFCPPLRAVTVPESFCRLKDPARRSFTQQSE